MCVSALPAKNQQKAPSGPEEPRPDQPEPKPLCIKEEERWVSLEGEEVSGRKETDATRFPFTAVLLKEEDDDGIAVFSQLHQQQMEARELPSRSSADLLTAANVGEDGGRAETTTSLAVNTLEDGSSSSETDASNDDDASSTHSKLKHSSGSGSKTEDSDTDWKESNSKCSECSNRFLSNGPHDSHVTSHPRLSSSNCLVEIEGIEIKTNADSHGKVQTKLKSFSCDNCGKRCTRSPTSSTHGTNQTVEKPFVCRLCGWRFRSLKKFDKHMMVHKPFACDICGYRFGNKSHLRSHMRIHSGEKPFACDICELRFIRNSHLTRHMRRHTGQKLYTCEICKQTFTRKEHLDRHMRRNRHRKENRSAVNISHLNKTQEFTLNQT